VHRGARGYDPAKMMVGRKRVALVDADGVWLAVATVPASVQERDTLPALDGGSTHWPSLRVAIFDGGFTADRCRNGPTSMACATTWSAANPDRKALLCCRAVGWSNAALAGLRIGAACCATAPDGWMSQPGVSPSSPSGPVFRHCSIQCQSGPLDYENLTQTGS
jgi:transposase